MRDDLAYFEEPGFKKIYAKYTKALENGTPVYMEADELTDIAEYYMTKGKEEQANQAIELALTLHPTDVDPQIFLSRQQMFHDNMEEAHRIADAIMDQNDREVQFLHSELMIRDGKTEDSYDFLIDNANALEGQDRALYLYDSACIMLDYSAMNEAKKFSDILTEEYPNFKHNNELLVDIMLSTGDYKHAIPLLQTILDSNPYDTVSWNLLAEAYGAEEMYNEGIDAAEYVLAIDEGNERAMLTKANCLFHQNNLEEAHLLYQEHLNVHPDDDTIYYLDSVCLTALNRFEEAAESLRMANKCSNGMSMEQVHIYLQQALVESRLKHLEKALEALDNALEIVTDEFTIDANLLRGQIFLACERFSESSMYFEKALLESKDRHNTTIQIGISLFELQYYDASARSLETAINHYPNEDNSTAKPYLAYCYMMLNMGEEYVYMLREAAEECPETTELLFASQFPGVTVKEYYTYAYKKMNGSFPKE